jgi:molecular chaperone GrpE
MTGNPETGTRPGEAASEPPVDASIGGGPVPDPDAEAVQADADAVEADLRLASLARERDEYLDALRRLQADFENYKKRMLKQQTDYLERAAVALVEKLLPVLDTVDLAVAHGGGEAVEQIWTALNDTLAQAGLERIDPLGDRFDPTQHDAVLHEPGDGEAEVADVMRAGYRWKGRVLRPAMVKVRGS